MADNIRVNWGKLLSRILLYFVIVLICLFILSYCYLRHAFVPLCVHSAISGRRKHSRLI